MIGDEYDAAMALISSDTASDDEDAEEDAADAERLRVVSAGGGSARDAENWTVLF